MFISGHEYLSLLAALDNIDPARSDCRLHIENVRSIMMLAPCLTRRERSELNERLYALSLKARAAQATAVLHAGLVSGKQ